MKNKALFIAVTILFSSLHLFAQTQDAPDSRPPAFTGSELFIAHGYMPLSQYNMNENTDVTALGAVSLGYRYHFSRLLSLGVVGSYEHSSNNYAPTSYASTVTDRRGIQSCYTMATEVTFNYLTIANGTLRFYGVFGAGYSIYVHIIKSKNNGVSSVYKNSRSTYGALQIAPIGIRFGRDFGGFLELGSGYRGIVNYGLTYRF